MRTLVIILSLLLTLVITGVLHSTHTQYDETGTIMVERVYSYQFPNHIHDCIVLDPAMSLAAR